MGKLDLGKGSEAQEPLEQSQVNSEWMELQGSPRAASGGPISPWMLRSSGAVCFLRLDEAREI